MSASPPATPPLDGILGAIVIGAVVGTFLFGIGTLQTYHYYRRYSSDSKALKTLVGALWFMELGHSISIWHTLYQIVVTFFGQLPHILNPPHSVSMSVLFAALSTGAVQTFYAFRIRRLSGHWFIPIICFLLTAARFSFNVLMLITFWTSSSGFELMKTRLHWAMISVSSLAPSVDILTAGSLCFYLWKIRSRGGHIGQTRTMLDTLILWSVETTTITSAAGILQLILFLSRPDLAWMALFLIQPKLFSNSILAHLNGRQRFRKAPTVHNLMGSGNYDPRVATQDVGVVFRMETISESGRDIQANSVEKTGHISQLV
ncbi:hypothetical protein DFH08DRAFT_1075450 [Mycena albidolilacea]|uniref:DUF6534 domain-containing protein n=1 Tax=Mycena albidolilacea TaxID=1033008 RepID=A0AAD7AGR6_9AGAR|nr:hypothetical protein DFH08DRAFT_1075450 [Mycena albidolilacea]